LGCFNSDLGKAALRITLATLTDSSAASQPLPSDIDEVKRGIYAIPRERVEEYIRYSPRGRFNSMPAKSKKQQMAAGAALAATRGERDKSSLKGASKKMAESMSEKQLKDFAKTKRKRLPTKKG
jgi:hypothetical protein